MATVRGARCRGGAVWVKQEGRLVKLQETVIDSDISIIGSDNSEAINKLIVQNKVKGKSRQRIRLHQESPLVQLPREIMVMIISLIPAKAVGALARSCKGLEDFVNQNYVESVILPLSLGNMRKLGVRSVLNLTSSIYLGIWEEGQYMKIIRKMNLKQVKRLKFNGPNFMGSNFIADLSKQYVAALSYYIAHGENLESLDMLVDSSVEVMEVIKSVALLPRLEEVTLRSSGRLATFLPNPVAQDMNVIINMLLSNPSVKKLSLKGFSVPWTREFRAGEHYKIVITSASLETLKIEASKCFEFGAFNTPNLRDLYVDGDGWGKCLYHSDPELDPETACFNLKSLGMGRRAALLAQGCPRLQRYNDLDLAGLVKSGRSWLEQLVNHRGKGVGGDSEISVFKAFDNSKNSGCQLCCLQERRDKEL